MSRPDRRRWRLWTCAPEPLKPISRHWTRRGAQRARRALVRELGIPMSATWVVDARDGETVDPEYFESEPCCGRCGSSMRWVQCEQGCDEDGMVECGDSIGCCDGDHPCAFCHGSAGWWICCSTPDWCDAHPRPGREHVERSTVALEDYVKEEAR